MLISLLLILRLVPLLLILWLVPLLLILWLISLRLVSLLLLLLVLLLIALLVLGVVGARPRVLWIWRRVSLRNRLPVLLNNCDSRSCWNLENVTGGSNAA